jgi:hypothetical protein
MNYTKEVLEALSKEKLAEIVLELQDRIRTLEDEVKKLVINMGY